ncbi:MAG: hypothetical protein V7K14_23725 [Nostoc sp.]|nr:hypothetical protein [Nostoc sp. NMS7]MBN3949855.1 hypothetical protein [Nostoc sp. NMS7]
MSECYCDRDRLRQVLRPTHLANLNITALSTQIEHINLASLSITCDTLFW